MINAINVFADEVSFMGNHFPVFDVIPEKSTGLDKIFVLKDLEDVSICVDVEEFKNAKWSMFGNMGAAYALPIVNVLNID